MISHQWLCADIMPHIACKFRNDTKLCNIFGLVVMYACLSDSQDIEVCEHIWHQVQEAHNWLALEETLSVMKLPLLVHQLGDHSQISCITGNDLLSLGGRGNGE